ncbi:MAG: AraC family transcriptional regulator [Pseudomonadales bacterium]|nr:AraC family transcriptional regulator [Pseudomonadales bacterium]
MADFVEKHGGDKSETLLKKAGIKEAVKTDFSSFITVAQYEALLKESLASTNDPALGLSLGKAIEFGDHGTLAFSALSYPNVWEALAVCIKYSKLANQIVEFKLEEDGQFNTIRIETVYFTGSLYQTLIEIVTCLICEILKFMLDGDISSLELRFCYGPPEYADLYQKFFEPSITFESSINEIRIPKQLAQKPQAMANPAVARHFESQCDEQLAQLNLAKSFQQQVREALFLSRGGFPHFDEIADKLNLSPRTLRRRLQENDTSYKQILDEVRLEIADRYLSTTSLSIGEIAPLVGYTDQNSFSHAYRQLKGITPTSYRKQSRK